MIFLRLPVADGRCNRSARSEESPGFHKVMNVNVVGVRDVIVIHPVVG